MLEVFDTSNLSNALQNLPMRVVGHTWSITAYRPGLVGAQLKNNT